MAVGVEVHGPDANNAINLVDGGCTTGARVHHKVVYFAHDLCDPAVHRRVRMLQAGGSEVVLLGFRRSSDPVRSVDGIEPFDLGKTTSRQFAKRVGSVLRVLATLHRHRREIHNATTVIARQLEMLVIANLARQRFAPPAALVFECLDIHYLMMSSKLVGKLMRRLERAMLRRCDLLVVSSPAFLSEYFEPVHRSLPRSLLLENRVLAAEIDALGSNVELPAGPPWRIGWYGSIRCRRSLHLLANLVDALPGQVEVVIAGNYDPVVMHDLESIVAASPGMALLGPYDRRNDLGAMYASVHFSWTLDYFEPTGNSRWLLPNRLYEGGVYGALPIALREAETGGWLRRYGAGILLDDPPEETMLEFFRTLDTERYLAEKAAFSRIPQSAFLYDDQDCAAFCQLLADPRRHP